MALEMERLQARRRRCWLVNDTVESPQHLLGWYQDLRGQRRKQNLEQGSAGHLPEALGSAPHKAASSFCRKGGLQIPSKDPLQGPRLQMGPLLICTAQHGTC